LPDPAQPPFLLRLSATVGAIRLDLNLNLTAPWTVIFGPSGSGKTTVLRAICGLLTGADMHCSCRGTELNGNHTAIAIKDRRIAYAPQEASLFPHLTVRENIAFAAKSRNVAIAGLVDEALAQFELQPLAERMPRDLSGGERQRVSLARAFAVPEPRLMLLDEPFTGIGRAQRAPLLSTMREAMAARGVQVISVTHDVEEAFLLDAEVIRLEAGRVMAQGPAEAVLAEERQEMLLALGCEAMGA
jgi:molybdate transport system ATP-binding protein